METFAALKLEIKSWRWDGVPFYIRSGKNLPVTCTEAVVTFRKPPQTIDRTPNIPPNYMRFRISPEMTVAMAVSISNRSGSGPRETVELIASPPPPP